MEEELVRIYWVLLNDVFAFEFYLLHLMQNEFVEVHFH